ncbi:protein ENHANCED DISEASE RESISTANCE 2 isoform X2 [Arachis hypogaea]|uniref:protein ENHANCED DISEASE RESISTANCE 2 isoform X2 n=1 Tax=Arachis hypogaea TaxID=3818 RepID=UPI003B21DDD1
MAVGVVDGSSEAIFQTSMSLGPSRSALVEHVDGHTDVIHKELYRDWLPCCCPASAISVEKEKVLLAMAYSSLFNRVQFLANS